MSTYSYMYTVYLMLSVQCLLIAIGTMSTYCYLYNVYLLLSVVYCTLYSA